MKPSSTPWRLNGIEDGVAVHPVDITDAARVEDVIQRIRPTIVYHLATHGAYHYQNEPEPILLVNVTGLWNVVRACSKVGFDLFVNTGSSSEYGAKSFAMRETDVLEPDSFYAVAKSAQSLLCRHVGRSTRQAIVTLRLFSVYGPYEEPTRLVPRLMMAAIEGKPIDMASPTTVRDFVYVDDVVDAFVRAATRGGGLVCNVGTGQETSVNELLAVMAEQAGVSVTPTLAPARPGELQRSSLDIERAAIQLGWRPWTNLPEGTRAVLEYVRPKLG